MNHAQQQALGILQAALLDATEAGVLGMLTDFTKSPDSINDVCDAVDQLQATVQSS